MPLLISGRRHRIMPPTKVLRALGLRRGMTMVDVGCGPGFFCLPACRVVGKTGRVIATDTSPSMLRALRDESKKRGLENLKLQKSRDPEISSPDGCADLAMLGFVLHETASVPRFLREVARVLRPGGRAAVMEWHPIDTEYGPPLRARLSMSETKRAVREAGLLVDIAWDFDGDTYFVMARHKKKTPGGGSPYPAVHPITRRTP
jgi:ubiquinone/menaquinone biosynthesis C-methylase UbiE